MSRKIRWCNSFYLYFSVIVALVNISMSLIECSKVDLDKNKRLFYWEWLPKILNFEQKQK